MRGKHEKRRNSEWRGKVYQALKDILVIWSKVVKILLKMKIFIPLSSKSLLQHGMKQKANERQKMNEEILIKRNFGRPKIFFPYHDVVEASQNRDYSL